MAGPLSLRVNLPGGDITVRTGDDGQVTLQGTKHVWGIGQADAGRRLNAFQVRIEQSRNQVNITGTDPGGARPRAPRVDLLITVPRQMALQLVTGVGSIQVEGTQGDATIRADVGRVVLTDVLPVGKLEVQSRVATIELNGRLAPKAIYQVTSDIGGISLHVPGESSFSIDARSDIGKVSVGFEVNGRNSQQGIAGRQVSSDMGPAPSTKLTIRSRMGDIVVDPR